MARSGHDLPGMILVLKLCPVIATWAWANLVPALVLPLALTVLFLCGHALAERASQASVPAAAEVAEPRGRSGVHGLRMHAPVCGPPPIRVHRRAARGSASRVSRWRRLPGRPMTIR